MGQRGPKQRRHPKLAADRQVGDTKRPDAPDGEAPCAGTSWVLPSATLLAKCPESALGRQQQDMQPHGNFRQLIERRAFRNAKSPLTLILGQNSAGRLMTIDLTRAPHVLVSGAVGTGTSICINGFIASLLFRATPDEVKFVLIDISGAAFAACAGIPHLLVPVIEEARKAELALNWLCDEIFRRQTLFKALDARHLWNYKANLRQLHMLRRDQEQIPEDPPCIIVIIQEFADLIDQAGKAAEVAVARLAQKGRAVGIHVILATQRPSVDVITGLIRANFPTRVSFRVATAVDSVIVLGQLGADALSGTDELLLLQQADGQARRGRGAVITSDEFAALAKFWRDQGAPVYGMVVLAEPECDKEMADEADVASEDAGANDALYPVAVAFVVELGRPSVAALQRALGIGYGRAARLILAMAARGVLRADWEEVN